MEEEKKVNDKTGFIIGIIVGIVVMGLVGLLAWNLGVQFANNEDKANKPEQTQVPEMKEEVVTVNEEEMNKKLSSYYWVLANFDSNYGTTVEHADGSGSLSYLEAMKDGDNLLNTKDKKILFALLTSGLTVLRDDQVCNTLNATGCGTGNRAVKVDEFKESYKKVFNEEVMELKNCEGNIVATPTSNCVLNGYLTYYEITGLFEPTYIKLFYNKLTKLGNVYTLVIDAKDSDASGVNPSYIDNGKQIIVEYTKDNDNISIKSMTYKKA